MNIVLQKMQSLAADCGLSSHSYDIHIVNMSCLSKANNSLSTDLVLLLPVVVVPGDDAQTLKGLTQTHV